MNVPQEDLNLWRGFFETLRVSMFEANREMAAGHSEAVKEILTQTASAAARMGIRLERAGADRPDSLPPRREVPLALLDTPANRRYMRALQTAYEAGKEVDAERYGPHEDGPAAGGVELLMMNVELEVMGPAGARE